jgi:hypothetical protein
MKQTSKKELIVIKSVEPRGWESISECQGGGIPPLGTINDDGVKTSEDIAAGLPIVLRDSIPVRGGFEILIGKTSLSFKTEPDKADSQDISYPKDYVRGHDTYSGQFEFEQLKNSQRIQGAVDGFFDYTDCMYKPYTDFRLFEIWTIVNPQTSTGECDMSLNAAKCDLLMKHYEVIFDSLDESRDIPNKLSVPISRRFYERYKNFTFPTTFQAIMPSGVRTTTGGIGGTSTYAVPAQPRQHTRIHIPVTAGTGNITIAGINIFGEPVEETIACVVSTASVHNVGDVYFTQINSVTISANMTFSMQDFDYGLRNPV